MTLRHAPVGRRAPWHCLGFPYYIPQGDTLNNVRYTDCFQCLGGMLLKTSEGGKRQFGWAASAARDSRLGQPRSVVVAGKRTSLRLEPTVWLCLNDIVALEGISLDELVSRIEKSRRADRGLASEVRVFVADYWRKRPGE